MQRIASLAFCVIPVLLLYADSAAAEHTVRIDHYDCGYVDSATNLIYCYFEQVENDPSSFKSQIQAYCCTIELTSFANIQLEPIDEIPAALFFNEPLSASTLLSLIPVEDELGFTKDPCPDLSNYFLDSHDSNVVIVHFTPEAYSTASFTIPEDQTLVKPLNTDGDLLYLRGLLFLNPGDDPKVIKKYEHTLYMYNVSNSTFTSIPLATDAMPLYCGAGYLYSVDLHHNTILKYPLQDKPALTMLSYSFSKETYGLCKAIIPAGQWVLVFTQFAILKMPADLSRIEKAYFLPSQ